MPPKTLNNFFSKKEKPTFELTPESIPKLTVIELKKYLKERQQPIDGVKNVLVERLINSLSITPKPPNEELKDTEQPKKEPKKRGRSESDEDKEDNEDSEDTEPEPENESISFDQNKKLKLDPSVKSKSFLLEYLTEPTWENVLQDEFKKTYFSKIESFIQEQIKANKTIYPPLPLVFNAFNTTPLNEVKAVIIGQDPYFNERQAHGLCFSVQRGVAVPPSLKNMYKELEKTVPGFKTPKHGCLEKWSSQGVLMLNATLTVEKGKANSHSKCGWQDFTDAVISVLNKHRTGIVYLLWGLFAQKKGKLVNTSKNFTINSAHPSPLAGNAFQGSNCFKKCNEILVKNGQKPIDWTLPLD